MPGSSFVVLEIKSATSGQQPREHQPRQQVHEQDARNSTRIQSGRCLARKNAHAQHIVVKRAKALVEDDEAEPYAAEREQHHHVAGCGVHNLQCLCRVPNRIVFAVVRVTSTCFLCLRLTRRVLVFRRPYLISCASCRGRYQLFRRVADADAGSARDACVRRIHLVSNAAVKRDTARVPEQTEARQEEQTGHCQVFEKCTLVRHVTFRLDRNDLVCVRNQVGSRRPFRGCRTAVVF